MSELSRSIEMHTGREFERNVSIVEDIKNGKNDVLIDLDNTISNQVSRQADFVRRRAKEEGIVFEDPKDYTIIKVPELESIRKQYYKEQDEFMDQSLIHGVKPGLKILKKAGFNLHVVSTREEGLHEITKEWLKHVGVSEFFNSVSLGNPDLGEKFKANVGKEKDALCMIDDLANVTDKLSKEGINAIRIKRKWMSKIVQSDDVVELPSFYRASLYLAKQKAYAMENNSD